MGQSCAMNSLACKVYWNLIPSMNTPSTFIYLDVCSKIVLIRKGFVLLVVVQGTSIIDESHDQDTTDLHKCVVFIKDCTPNLDKSNVRACCHSSLSPFRYIRHYGSIDFQDMYLQFTSHSFVGLIKTLDCVLHTLVTASICLFILMQCACTTSSLGFF